jgi:hypothetical protein
MCRPISEGGQRCAAHTRVKEQQARDRLTAVAGDPAAVVGAHDQWVAAATDYASTEEGQQTLAREEVTAQRSGDIDRAAVLHSIIERGASKRQANIETRQAVQARTAETSTAEAGAAEDPGWTMTGLGEVTLGRSKFRVERQDYTDRSSHTTWLHGERGAVYFLRPYAERGGDTGLRQVISWKSGAPLRQQGNEVRVVEFGTHIETYVAKPRAIH